MSDSPRKRPQTLHGALVEARLAIRHLGQDLIRTWPLSVYWRWTSRLAGYCGHEHNHPFTGRLMWCGKDSGHEGSHQARGNGWSYQWSADPDGVVGWQKLP